MFFQILLGVAILAGVIFLAISRKSGKVLRIAALGALALMVLSVIISLFVIFRGNTSPVDEFMQEVMPFEEPARSGPGTITMLLFLVSLVALFVVVFYLSMREQKRTNQPPPPRNDFF